MKVTSVNPLMPVLVSYETSYPTDEQRLPIKGQVVVLVDYMTRRAFYASGEEVDAAMKAGIFEDIVQQQEAMSPDVPLEAIQKVMSTKSNLGVKPLWKRTE